MAFVDAQGLRPFTMVKSLKGASMSQPMRAGKTAQWAGKPARVDATAPSGVDGEALARFLRRRHPRNTAGYVAAATQIPEATIKDWLLLRCRPSSANLMRLAETPAYGVALMEACWRRCPDFIAEAALHAEASRLRGEIAAAQARLDAISQGVWP